MGTEQAGAVVVQVTAGDFGRLWQSSSPRGIGDGSGSFQALDGGQPSPRQWARIYWIGRDYAPVIFARAFLAARGFDYEILYDTASDVGGPMFGYVILTDYEDRG